MNHFVTLVPAANWTFSGPNVVVFAVGAELADGSARKGEVVRNLQFREQSICEANRMTANPSHRIIIVEVSRSDQSSFGSRSPDSCDSA